jgi:hypothetical protein
MFADFGNRYERLFQWDHLDPTIVYTTSFIADPIKSAYVLFWFRLIIFLWASISAITGIVGRYGWAGIKKWIFFVTNWGMLLTIIYFGLSTYISAEQLWKFGDFSNSTNITEWSILTRIVVIFYQVAFSLECIIVPVYWIALHKHTDAIVHPEEDTIKHPFCNGSMNLLYQIHTHGLMGVFLLVDHVVNDMKFIPIHSLYVIVFTLFYMYMNRWYTLKYEPVYPILKWDSWVSYAETIAFCAIAVMMFFFGHYLQVVYL